MPTCIPTPHPYAHPNPHPLVRVLSSVVLPAVAGLPLLLLLAPGRWRTPPARGTPRGRGGVFVGKATVGRGVGGSGRRCRGEGGVGPGE